MSASDVRLNLGVSVTRVHIGVLLDTSATSAVKRRHFIMWTATSCVEAVCLIDLLTNMPLADDEFVDEIIDGIRYNEPYRIEAIRDEVQNG